MSDKRRVEIAIYLAFFALIMCAPLLLDPFWLNRIAKYLVFGMLGVAVALSWGYAGILNLGQGLFFGGGAYMLAMSLKLASPTSLQQGSDKPVPDFMLWNAEPGAPTELCCINKASFLWLPFQSPVVRRRHGGGAAGRARHDHRNHRVSQAHRGRVRVDHHAGAGAAGAARGHRRPAHHQRLQRADRPRMVQGRRIRVRSLHRPDLLLHRHRAVPGSRGRAFA